MNLCSQMVMNWDELGTKHYPYSKYESEAGEQRSIIDVIKGYSRSDQTTMLMAPLSSERKKSLVTQKIVSVLYKSNSS